MPIISYFFNLFFAFFLLGTYSSACFTTQENDVVYKGFQHFLDSIHHYQCDQLRGGLSKNTQYICAVNDNKYVARMLKEPLAIRRNEVSIHRVAAYHGIAPAIHYYDDNEYSCVIMDFIEGQTLLFDDAQRRDVLDLIVHKVKTIGQFDDGVLRSGSQINLRALMIRYYQKIREYADPVLEFILENALSAFEMVCQSIEKEYRPLLFGHNDLHPRNILCIHNDMMIIDWETGAFNYELYDVANYSVYACLQEADEQYVLTRYLQRDPVLADLNYFKKVKQVVKLFNAFGFLICLDAIPDACDIESVEAFSYYARIFAEDTNANDPAFLYELALSLLRDFFEEYEQIAHDNV